MTCIVGLVDTVNNCVWVGGDSLETSLCSKSVEHTPKVFRNELFQNVVIGGTTSFRHLDLLRYANDLFPEIDLYRKLSIDHRYMVTVFIPNLAPADRIKIALEAAEKFSSMVQRPFHVLNTLCK